MDIFDRFKTKIFSFAIAKERKIIIRKIVRLYAKCRLIIHVDKSRVQVLFFLL